MKRIIPVLMIGLLLANSCIKKEVDCKECEEFGAYNEFLVAYDTTFSRGFTESELDTLVVEQYNSSWRLVNSNLIDLNNYSKEENLLKARAIQVFKYGNGNPDFDFVLVKIPSVNRVDTFSEFITHYDPGVNKDCPDCPVCELKSFKLNGSMINKGQWPVNIQKY